MSQDWFRIENAGQVPSPALLVYPDRIAANIDAVIRMAGSPDRLRPHVKTHKMREVIRMHLERGITRFKCATIAEAEMTAAAGGTDILLANQLVGPNLQRFDELRAAFPGARFSTLCDNAQTMRELSRLRAPVPVYLDIDCGQGRTGIAPGPDAQALYRVMFLSAAFEAAGFHVYDGHIHDANPTERRQNCEAAWKPVDDLRNTLIKEGLPVPSVVAGGTPTFPFHAQHPARECSPGTYVFWDFGYHKFEDLPFQLAAVLLTRVISKPSPTCLCLDLGHKAVASENPQPRVQFLNLPDATVLMHNEEHLVVETANGANCQVGDVVYAVPRHICPTVALHDEVWAVREAVAKDRWPVAARGRRITI